MRPIHFVLLLAAFSCCPLVSGRYLRDSGSHYSLSDSSDVSPHDYSSDSSDSIEHNASSDSKNISVHDSSSDSSDISPHDYSSDSSDSIAHDASSDSKNISAHDSSSDSSDISPHDYSSDGSDSIAHDASSDSSESAHDVSSDSSDSIAHDASSDSKDINAHDASSDSSGSSPHDSSSDNNNGIAHDASSDSKCTTWCSMDANGKVVLYCCSKEVPDPRRNPQLPACFGRVCAVRSPPVSPCWPSMDTTIKCSSRFHSVLGLCSDSGHASRDCNAATTRGRNSNSPFRTALVSEAILAVVRRSYWSGRAELVRDTNDVGLVLHSEESMYAWHTVYDHPADTHAPNGPTDLEGGGSGEVAFDVGGGNDREDISNAIPMYETSNTGDIDVGGWRVIEDITNEIPIYGTTNTEPIAVGRGKDIEDITNEIPIYGTSNTEPIVAGRGKDIEDITNEIPIYGISNTEPIVVGKGKEDIEDIHQ